MEWAGAGEQVSIAGLVGWWAGLSGAELVSGGGAGLVAHEARLINNPRAV